MQRFGAILALIAAALATAAAVRGFLTAVDPAELVPGTAIWLTVLRVLGLALAVAAAALSVAAFRARTRAPGFFLMVCALLGVFLAATLYMIVVFIGGFIATAAVTTSDQPPSRRRQPPYLALALILVPAAALGAAGGAALLWIMNADYIRAAGADPGPLLLLLLGAAGGAVVGVLVALLLEFALWSLIARRASRSAMPGFAPDTTGTAAQRQPTAPLE